MNFGTIKDIFIERLVESHISGEKSGKNLYKKFLQTLKENETLKTAFIVYKNIECVTINDKFEANQYLKENLSLVENFIGKNSIIEQTKKLTKILTKNNVDFKDKDIKELHESLHVLTTTTNSVNTVNKLHKSRVNVINWLTTDKTKEEKSEYVKENINPKKFLNIAVEKFNEKYSDLTEEEKDILKTLKESKLDDLKRMVSKLVKDTISIINENLDKYKNNVTIKEKLLETKDVIYRKSSDEDIKNMSDKILELYGLKNKFNNE